MYQKTRIILDWTSAIFIYSLNLLIIPFSDKLTLFLDTKSVDAILNFTVNALIGLVFLSLLLHLIKKGRGASFFSYLWWVVFLSISTYFLMRVEITRDRLHFLGYGILSLFLYRALRHNIATKMLYVYSGLLIICFAVLDESLQLSGLGGRSFEFKDIRTDWLSSLVGQGIIAFVVRPKLETIGLKIRTQMRKLKNLKSFVAKRSQKQQI